MKFCVDCEYYKSPLCCSPKNGYDLVTGRVNKTYCRESRREYCTGTVCGPEGKFFKEKTKEQRRSELFASVKKLWSN